MEDGHVHVGVVVTGGTIGSVRRGEMVVIDLNDRSYAEITLVEQSWAGPGRLRVHSRVPVRKLSEDMNQSDWLAIANAVRELVEVEEQRDILIFHGTDTAAYTAAALSFLLADLDATIIVTGANIPATEYGSDASTNVRDALIAARHLRPGVYLSFAGVAGAPSEIHLGGAVRKLKAQSQSYESPNIGPIARVVDAEVEIIRTWPNFRVRKGVNQMSSDVELLVSHPGIDFRMYADAFIKSGKRGVVVRMYPSATSPDNVGKDSLPNFVRRCIAEGMVVVACLERYVPSNSKYPSLEAIEKAGAIFAADMIPEAAFVKLCWALGQTNDKDEAKFLFEQPVAGESLLAARKSDHDAEV